MKTLLKKKLQFLKYSFLFSKNSLFFVCLLFNNKHFFFTREQLIINNFIVKFSKNKLVQKLFYFINVKKFFTNPIFLVSKEELDYNDFLIIEDLLLKESYVILFFFNNKFYTYNKFKLLSNYILNFGNKFSGLCTFYLTLKLGFLFKFHYLRQYQII